MDHPNLHSSQAMDIYPFSDEKQQVLFDKLIHELRCSVCQNQNLADSMAPLAVDLRGAIYHQVVADFKEEAILNFVTHRYGTFVLYDPPFMWGTALLWTGPFLMLYMVYFCLRRFFSKDGKRTSC